MPSQSSAQRTYIVVPFQRVGVTIGPSQPFAFDAAAKAHALAREIASRVSGVAILERETDPETGDDRERLIAGMGAIPPRFPADPNWTLRLS